MTRLPAESLSNQKGGANAVDYCRNTRNSLVAGTGERLYDGFIYSYPVGRCHHRRTGQSYSRAETVVVSGSI